MPLIRFFDVFAGIGGFRSGLEKAGGFECVGYCEIRTRLDDAGLAVWSVGSPFGKIGICDDFAPHLDSFKRCLEYADILGAEHLRLFSFYGTAELDPVPERLRKFIDAARGSGGHSTERDHREKLKWKR